MIPLGLVSVCAVVFACCAKADLLGDKPADGEARAAVWDEDDDRAAVEAVPLALPRGASWRDDETDRIPLAAVVAVDDAGMAAYQQSMAEGDARV